MRKKVVAMMMAAALVVSTAACGSSGSSSSSKSESNTGSQAAATSEVANKDKPLVWFNRQPSNSSTGELDKTALNFNKDTYYVGFDANQGAEVQGQMVKDYIEKNIDKLFLNYHVLCAHPYRVMRNADLPIDEDEAADLLKEIQKQLKKRQWGEVIRLEVEASVDKKLLRFLKEGQINIKVALVAALGALVGSPLGAQLAMALDEKYLNYILLVAVPVIAVLVLRKKDFGRERQEEMPLLRSVLFGMPPMFPVAISMAFELATYGLVSGLLWRKAKHTLPALYAVLLTAMVSGRIVWGIVRFVLAGLTGGSFPFSAFLSGALFTAVPGIVAQLVLIPLLLTALQKAGFAD